MCEVLFDVVIEECNIAGYYNDETNVIVIGKKSTKHMVCKERSQRSNTCPELVHFLQKQTVYMKL